MQNFFFSFFKEEIIVAELTKINVLFLLFIRMRWGGEIKEK